MRLIRRQLANRKLLVIIVVFWLAAIIYAAQESIAYFWRQYQLQEQNKKQMLLPESAQAAYKGRYKPPMWQEIVKGIELSGRILNSDAHTKILSGQSSRRGDYFDPRINATEISQLMNLFWQVDEFCKRHGLVYFMYAATLTGSHRHHGLVPWDDDIDIMIPMSQRSRFIYLMRTRAQHLRLYTWAYHWKIWSPATAAQIIRSNYGWPFVDLFFYGENETHIYDMDPAYTAIYSYEKEIVFPLHNRPFMGRWLPAPRDTSKFLVRTVRDPDGCHSPYYLHKEEKPPKTAVGTSCDMLRDRFPFALKSLPSSESGSDGIVESMYLGDTLLHSVLVQEPTTSITFNYSLRLINSDGVQYAEPFS